MISSHTAVPAVGTLPVSRPPAAEQTALAALSHPLTLAAVGLLLLNDHVFKSVFPSILTGKLSDFAGLFFFPFLMAAAIELVCRFGSDLGRSRSVMAVCFAATALGFAWIKVDPAGNALAVRILETVLGMPARIVRDPTDLIALAALWPAWRLWRSLPARGPAGSPRSLLALGLASLAALATAPCPPEMPVSHVMASGGGVYALTSPWNSAEGVYRNTSGSGWDAVGPSEVPPELVEAAAEPVELPKVACVPDLEQTCYRAGGEEKLQASSDGGATWQVVWSAPSARRAFMQRVAEGHGQLLACGKRLDFRVTDVVILGRGSDHLAVVALGNEGVLRGRLGSSWERQGVGPAQPTPERGDLKDVPALTVGETAAALLAAAAAMLLFSIHAWRRLRVPEADGGPRRSDTPLRTGIVVTLLVLILMFALDVETLIPYAIVPLVGLAAWIVFLWTGWLRTLRGTNDTGRVWKVLGQCVLGCVLVGLAVWIPFALWTMGVIPGYGSALAIALAATAVVIILFWRMIQPRNVSPSAA